MNATGASVTDEVIREIAEQVSQTMRRKLPKWGGTPFDTARGVEMYRAHLGISIPSSEISLQDAAQLSPEEGGAPQGVGVYVLKLEGEDVYVGRAIEDRPDQATKGSRKRLQEHARGASTSSEKIRSHREELTVEIYSTGSSDAAKSLESKKINELKTHTDDGGWNKRKEVPVSYGPDAVKRTASNVAIGVISDLALFSVGGAAMEIRDAWLHPYDMSLLERCKRLIRAIWERFLPSLKDRSLREIGSEALVVALASILSKPFTMAAAAVEKVVETLRRLWMDFCAGRLKTVGDVVAAALKAVFAVASVGVAVALETQLTPLLGGLPLGDLLSALCAAVVAGVMIVIGNRSIDHIMRSLFAIFEGAEIARRRREEIEAFCAIAIPQLVADRHRLESLVEGHLEARKKLLTRAFEDLRSASDHGDTDGFLKELVKINRAYGKALPWRTFNEFDELMQGSEPLKL